MYRRYRDIEEIKQANADAGQHFFKPDTMRFFNSRVLDGVIQGRYFVTSERPPSDEPRMYTARYATEDGHIETVGEFMAHATKAKAVMAAQLHAAEVAKQADSEV